PSRHGRRGQVVDRFPYPRFVVARPSQQGRPSSRGGSSTRTLAGVRAAELYPDVEGDLVQIPRSFENGLDRQLDVVVGPAVDPKRAIAATEQPRVGERVVGDE